MFFYSTLIFYPPPLAGGGCERKAVAGGGVFPIMFGNFATPQKFADANFYPPPQAAEGECVFLIRVRIRRRFHANGIRNRRRMIGGEVANNIKRAALDLL